LRECIRHSARSRSTHSHSRAFSPPAAAPPRARARARTLARTRACTRNNVTQDTHVLAARRTAVAASAGGALSECTRRRLSRPPPSGTDGSPVCCRSLQLEREKKREKERERERAHLPECLSNVAAVSEVRRKSSREREETRERSRQSARAALRGGRSGRVHAQGSRVGGGSIRSLGPSQVQVTMRDRRA